MTSKRLVSARAAGLALACLFSGAAFAQELGERVDFSGSPRSITFAAAPALGAVLFDSGESAAPTEPWDTVIFQGVSPDAGVSFEAARRDAAGRWVWREAEVRRHLTGRFWGRARLPSGARTVRLRAIDKGVAAAHAVELYSVETFASASAEAVSPGAAGPPARAEVPKPSVRDRGQWGAKPAKEPYTPHAPARMTLHHTDGRQTRTIPESEAELRFIQDFHQNGRGWNDIAYHFLIDGAGNIFQGRPETVVGSHTRDNNTGNIGIALLGNHHPPKSDPATAAEQASVVAIGRYLAAAYGIAPASLKGHRDYNATDCPGDSVYPLLAELRRRMAEAPRTIGRLRGSPSESVSRPSWSSSSRDRSKEGS